MNSENFDNLRLELRRGGLVVAVLAALHSEHAKMVPVLVLVTSPFAGKCLLPPWKWTRS